MQGCALSLLCQHVRLYLSDLCNEPGSLASCQPSLPVTEAEEQQESLHSHVGGLDHVLSHSAAHALLPQVGIIGISIKKCNAAGEMCQKSAPGSSNTSVGLNSK